MKILSSVSWGKPVIKLLSYSEELNDNYKTIYMIRHSAREEPKEITKIFKAPLTNMGKQAAFEFGRKLPNNRTYQIFHSTIDRCKETAQYIDRGIKSKEGRTIFQGEMENLTNINCNREKFIEYVNRDSNHFVEYWIAGHYPQEDIEPAINVAQRTAFEISQRSLFIEPNVINLYVTHDFHILVYLFYWAGIISESWIQYLDGFIMQFKENALKFFYNKGKKEVNLPVWWK
jgi:phosphohistidine phosphatase SixA